ncbi:MAG: HU family DNA-binding protein [Calditrichaeota bacterium]|nr:MAG: HU family DNA-binding protein [Calditrichota bacterium]
MTTQEVLKRLSVRLQRSFRETRDIYANCTQLFRDHLKAGNSFTIPNWGTFGTTRRAGRQAYNPHYKKTITLPARQVVVYKNAASLKKAINEARHEQ